MRERLEEILKLTGDDSFSHAARMISIRKLAEAGIEQLDAEKKAKLTGGAQTGNSIPPANKAPTPPPAK